jgi:hypothetical protein
MNRQIGTSNLYVTNVLYQELQTSLFREERSQAATLLTIKDNTTGKTGHLYHELEVDKRDILEENFWTDNTELFDDNPRIEAYEVQELSCCGPASTPTERTDDITDLISNCMENQLEYNEANPDGEDYDNKCWGLHPA